VLNIDAYENIDVLYGIQLSLERSSHILSISCGAVSFHTTKTFLPYLLAGSCKALVLYVPGHFFNTGTFLIAGTFL